MGGVSTTKRADRARFGGVPISTRAIDRFAFAHDASHYRLVPSGVATPEDTDDVVRLFRAASAARRPITFRSAGTSLSGQASTAGIVVDTRARFQRIEVLDDGARVRVQPGATVRQVNAHLARFGRALGPDPASSIACTVGGVVANNSSGMACGIEQNTYRTLESMVFVLPSGTVVDTADPDADERFRALEPDLAIGLLALRAQIVNRPDLAAEVRRQYAMKNTMGYGLNSFLDHLLPVRILEHLLIGSEGTLGFVASATFRTVPVLPHAATGLAVFPTLADATAALPELVGAGFATIELLDARSLRVAQGLAEVPAEIARLEVARQAALLVEVQGATGEALAERRARADPVLRALRLAAPVSLTSAAAERAALWTVRKGLYTAVAGARPSGTTALLEDVVVPVPNLLPTCEALTGLFDEHGYEGSVIFGHAKEGNIHFLLNERFSDPAQLARYERFTEDMVQVVLGQGGSLKAEHGTGRIMAPFVRRQFGPELYGVMREIKRLVDPAGILNPGVLISEDPKAHLHDLKLVPTVEAEVDRCVECGYCEPTCPSRDLTLTPRRRIALRREIQQAEASGHRSLAAELRHDYEYEGVETCAVDGLCGIACPVDINTGDLVRRLRSEQRGAAEQAVWDQLARGWGAATRVGGAALTVARFLPQALPEAVTRLGRAALGSDTVPLYSGALPGGGSARPKGTDPAQPADAVLFAACIGELFGPAADSPGATKALRTLAERAGVRLAIPDGLGAMCCGTPWKSKGYDAGHALMTLRVLPALLEASRGGALPIVCDAASCTEGLEVMRARAADAGGRYRDLRFVDSVRYAADTLLPRLTVRTRLPSIAVHPTCSTEQLGVSDALVQLAEAAAHEVVVPLDWGCCAFAGDRGLLHPELTASATRREAAEVTAREYAAYVSANRTCEIGMTRATGHEYRHVLEVLELATR